MIGIASLIIMSSNSDHLQSPPPTNSIPLNQFSHSQLHLKLIYFPLMLPPPPNQLGVGSCSSLHPLPAPS